MADITAKQKEKKTEQKVGNKSNLIPNEMAKELEP